MAKLRIEKNFGSAPNSLLNNPKISLKAKGLYTLIQSKPDDWDFSAIRLVGDSKDGKDSVLSGMKELEKFGYLERNYCRDAKGQIEVEYILYFEPKASTENPYKSSAENPTQENPHYIQKKNIQKNINISSNEEILCDEENSDFSLTNFSEKNSENITQTGHEEISQSSTDSTKLKLEQSSEAEKCVRKTSEASKTTELDEKKARMLAFLKNTVGCDKFKDYSEWQEAGRFLRLAEKLGKEQFLYRLENILEDPFKAKNSNKLSYLRKEIEAFIHSPILANKHENSVGQA